MACAKIFDSVKVVCEYGSWPDLFLAALTLYPLFFPESGREGFFQKKRCH